MDAKNKKLIKEIEELMDNNYSALCPSPSAELARDIIKIVKADIGSPKKMKTGR